MKHIQAEALPTSGGNGKVVWQRGQAKHPQIRVQPGDNGDLTGVVNLRLVNGDSDVELAVKVRSWPRTAQGYQELEALLVDLRRHFTSQILYHQRNAGAQEDDDIPF